MSQSEQIVPFNIEAEEAVLGSCLLGGEMTVMDVSAIIRPGDFYREVNAWVFEAMLNLYERRTAIDFLTVRDELERMGRLDTVGGPSFLASLINAVPTHTHAEHYATIVARTALYRRCIGAGSDIAKASYQEMEPDDLRDTVERIATAAVAGVGDGGYKKLGQVLLELDAQRSNSAAYQPPILTGLAALDRATGGLHRADMTVIAGESGHGKTSLLNTIALNVAKAGSATAYFSVEMQEERLADRLTRILTGIPFTRLQLPYSALAEWEVAEITRAYGELSAIPLYIADKRGQTVEEIVRKARQMHRHDPLGLLIVDYIQLIRTSRSLPNRTQDLDHIAYTLYSLAGELGVHVICAAQLVKERFSTEPPTLDKIRDSAGIVHAANNVLFVWRDKRIQTKEPAVLSQIHIGKQREGELDPVDVAWWGQRSTFVDLARMQDINEEARYARSVSSNSYFSDGDAEGWR